LRDEQFSNFAVPTLMSARLVRVAPGVAQKDRDEIAMMCA